MLIGDVARRCGVSVRMLRHYESLGLVRPGGRTGAGYREYSGEDVRRIFHIESLRSLGLSLRAVGQALDDPDFTPTTLVDDLIRRTRARIADETRLLTRLERIDAAGPGDWTDVLQTVALLRALGSSHAAQRQRAALAPVGAVAVEALVEAALGEPDPHVAGALRWAVARAGAAGLPLLAQGLDAPVAAVRDRAVRCLVEIPHDAATALLRDALDHRDVAVRRCAALTLGARGVPEAVPTLVDMVVQEANDVEAADALAALAVDAESADRIAAALVAGLTGDAVASPVRRRLTQALAGIPGERASRALAELAVDADRPVALTATYVLMLRDREP
ncbi:MerR family transcriptional regulator [Micromonospora sp. HM134]|uniref:MerR family transcriptional regulator n=1 Tax=unclassified Micromonospora TaxID=2617518 RepID=UPI0011985609|nr:MULTISPECIES: MerR family transcriptional regulator [unclassified Micromonospora]QDY08883.1 MerR family transcriptional regulator [Micromonospora sp. HM134]